MATRDGRDIYIAINSPRPVATGQLYQYDYGQILHFEGVTLPTAYEVHFAHSTTGEAKTAVGNADGVVIPDEFLLTGEDIVVWIYLHDTETDGETKYTCRIPVVRRAKPTNEEPTPVQQDTITQAIAALNEAVEATAADAASTAQSAAEAAQSATNAAQSEANARSSAESAQLSAESAHTDAASALHSAESALASAESAERSAESAENFADKAEQAAATSGYLWFYIESGKLYMDRTANTRVNFYLQDGQLYVTEVA